MKTKIKKKVNVQVHRIELKEWFEDSSLITFPMLREMRFDNEMHPLEAILDQDEIFIIRYSASNPENQDTSIGEPRAFITDLEHVIDFTLVDLITKLKGCHSVEVLDYPQKLQDLITEYCFGGGWFRLSLLEEYKKFKKYRHVDLSIPYFDEKIEHENNEDQRDKHLNKFTRKELLYLSTLKFIFDYYDRGELINLCEIYWQFCEPEDKNPYEVVSTPFFKQLVEKTMTEFSLKPKQVRRTYRGQLLVHKDIAWHYLIVMCDEIVVDKSFWERTNKSIEAQYVNDDIDELVKLYKEILRSYHELSDNNSKNH